MKLGIIALLLMLQFSNSCNALENSGRPFNDMVFKELASRTNNRDPLTIYSMTNFDWDKLYVFDLAVEDDEISQVLGIEFQSTSNQYSKKWFFEKGGVIVEREQKFIDEIEKPTKAGDVEFDITDSVRKFAVFKRDDLFTVEEKKIQGGRYFLLHCSTCK
ncbi:MAG TPA: hypothetical protein VK612_09090 [Pyrinomonadaceae bacterium]|nr:hypothetical protein [Pyrinomonadaceae bacterium]